MLVVMHGLPGVGKSTIAKKIAESIDAELLNTNRIRKDIMKLKQYENPEDKMSFTDSEIDESYNIMFNLAKEGIRKEKDVVLDATFHKRRFIDSAKRLGKSIVIEVGCPEEIIKERIEKRFKENKSDSIAGYEHYKEVRDNYFEKYEKTDFFIDTSKDIEGQVSAFLDKVKESG